MIWLNEGYFGHDVPYYIDDFKRTMHRRIMKQIVQESLKSQENTDAIFMIIGYIVIR